MGSCVLLMICIFVGSPNGVLSQMFGGLVDTLNPLFNMFPMQAFPATNYGFQQPFPSSSSNSFGGISYSDRTYRPIMVMQSQFTENENEMSAPELPPLPPPAPSPLMFEYQYPNNEYQYPNNEYQYSNKGAYPNKPGYPNKGRHPNKGGYGGYLNRDIPTNGVNTQDMEYGEDPMPGVMSMEILMNQRSILEELSNHRAKRDLEELYHEDHLHPLMYIPYHPDEMTDLDDRAATLPYRLRLRRPNTRKVSPPSFTLPTTEEQPLVVGDPDSVIPVFSTGSAVNPAFYELPQPSLFPTAEEVVTMNRPPKKKSQGLKMTTLGTTSEASTVAVKVTTETGTEPATAGTTVGSTVLVQAPAFDEATSPMTSPPPVTSGPRQPNRNNGAKFPGLENMNSMLMGMGQGNPMNLLSSMIKNLGGMG